MRFALGLSAAEAAKIAGLKNAQSWQRYENGLRSMPDSTAALFALRAAGLGMILKAARFAAFAHHGQTRKGAGSPPYIIHPMSVAYRLAEAFVTDPEIITAAILHDTIEDCAVTRADLKREFGARVAGIVDELTIDESLPPEEQRAFRMKKAPTMSADAATVKLADMVTNLDDLIHCPPSHWPAEKVRARAAMYLEAAKLMPPANARLLRAVFEKCGTLLGDEIG